MDVVGMGVQFDIDESSDCQYIDYYKVYSPYLH